ncbi:hypothetical protein [Pseudoclavibacter helvolus]|uniref:hypothetical protein n=1 Tax=Pseudoclavibacter helvolus TaxID=255205 RepID=UPI003C708711
MTWSTGFGGHDEYSWDWLSDTLLNWPTSREHFVCESCLAGAVLKASRIAENANGEHPRGLLAVSA